MCCVFLVCVLVWLNEMCCVFFCCLFMHLNSKYVCMLINMVMSCVLVVFMCGGVYKCVVGVVVSLHMCVVLVCVHDSQEYKIVLLCNYVWHVIM